MKERKEGRDLCQGSKDRAITRRSRSMGKIEHNGSCWWKCGRWPHGPLLGLGSAAFLVPRGGGDGDGDGRSRAVGAVPLGRDLSIRIDHGRAGPPRQGGGRRMVGVANPRIEAPPACRPSPPPSCRGRVGAGGQVGDQGEPRRGSQPSEPGRSSGIDRYRPDPSRPSRGRRLAGVANPRVKALPAKSSSFLSGPGRRRRASGRSRRAEAGLAAKRARPLKWHRSLST